MTTDPNKMETARPWHVICTKGDYPGPAFTRGHKTQEAAVADADERSSEAARMQLANRYQAVARHPDYAPR